MMTFLTYLLTFLLVLDCLLLGLLILIQLPKKEAGVGVAFGGGTTDALFGAGSGNALSNLTKYTSVAFFILVFVLSIVNNHGTRSTAADLRQQLMQPTAPVLSQATNSAKSTTTTPAIPLSISSSNVVTPAANAVSNAPVK